MVENLRVYQKVYDFMLWLAPTVQRFAKVHKYSLGVQLENAALELLKTIVMVNYQSDKRAAIARCFPCYEAVKVLVRLAHDYKLLSKKQYEFASRQLDEIGRLLGGWYKSYAKQ